MANYKAAGRQRRKHDRVDLLRFICDFLQKSTGRFPTFREIGDGFEISSSGAVSYILDGMVDDGILSTDGKSYQVPGSDWLPPLSCYDRAAKVSTAPNMFTERRLGIFQIKFSLLASLTPETRNALFGGFVPVRVIPMSGHVGLQYTAYSDLFDPVPDYSRIPFYLIHMTPRNDAWVSKGVYCE